MLHTWKRAFLFSSAVALMLAFGAPIQADDDDDDNGPDTIVERDKEFTKVTHIIRAKAQTGGSTSAVDLGYTLTGWKWLNPPSTPPLTTPPLVTYYLYTNTVSAAGLNVADTTASLQNGFLAWNVACDKAPTTASFSREKKLPQFFAKFRNGDNEIAWKSLNSKSTIAVTYSWYNNTTGEALEFDMAFNTGFPWSNSGEAKKMDVQNIVTHEAGHVFGLGHSTLSPDLTMYPYANYGETIRRTLETGDINGIQALYNPPATP